uniref:Uncharacterized protein n=1 Tax=Anguilla anguilla TaxID=7936 RepID=A0A0E9TBD8_ANGAN
MIYYILKTTCCFTLHWNCLHGGLYDFIILFVILVVIDLLSCSGVRGGERCNWVSAKIPNCLM